MKKDTHSPTSEKVQTTLGDTLKTAIQSAQKPQTEVKNSQTQTELKVAKNETPQEQKLAQSKTNTQGAIKEQMPIEPKTQALHQDAFVDENLLHSKESLAQDEQIQKPLPKQESLLMAAPAQEGVLSKLPLFTTTQTLASHSTAEFVSTKQTKAKEEHSVTKEPSLLGALLHGEKTPQSAEAKASITTDMNIKTTSSVLSQLLHGENTQPTNTQEQTALVTGTQEVAQDGQNSVHGEGASHTKEIQNDLSVKMNEAKQMTKYLAEDIKQAIEDYKAPFTRIKVKLNPQKLGEVDLTVVQRGKNIHVNISSNNSAIASLAQNVNELKMQLTQNGMNNATLNFSSAADAQTQQQQQNEQHKQGAKRAYEAFNQDKTTSEEMLTSLEIVLPQYI